MRVFVCACGANTRGVYGGVCGKHVCAVAALTPLKIPATFLNLVLHTLQLHNMPRPLTLLPSSAHLCAPHLASSKSTMIVTPPPSLGRARLLPTSREFSGPSLATPLARLDWV